MNIDITIDWQMVLAVMMVTFGLKAAYDLWRGASTSKEQRLADLYAQRDEVNEKIMAALGSSTKCPGCNLWEHESRYQTIWKEEPTGTVYRTCGGCGNVSEWVDGPGLMLLVKPGTAELAKA